MKIKPLIILKMVDTLEIQQVKKEAKCKGNRNFLVEAIIFILHRNFNFKVLKFEIMKSVKFTPVKL